MIVERTMHPSYLSNSYLVADRQGGAAVIVDTGGPSAPLLEQVARRDLTVTHVLLTHHHADHVLENAVYVERFGCPVVCHEAEADLVRGATVTVRHGDEIRSGDLVFRALHVPGHTAGQTSWLVNGERVFTGDTLFRGSVGGTRAPGHATFADLKRSVLDVLMKLPGDTIAYPGHSGDTTIGREWDENPFIRVWRGLDEPSNEPCRAAGRRARLIVRARDYDDGYKCWVRYEDGTDDIVPGSRVEC